MKCALCGQLHHSVPEGRIWSAGMARRNRGLDAGGDVGRADDVCPGRRHAGLEPRPRSRL